jgi:membrane-bound inhibitor of C-type lysozyme
MNITKVIGCALAAVMLSSGVQAATMSVKYSCAKGTKVQASYNGNRARVVVNGKIYLMTQAVSASGVRYIGGGYTWWTKGNKADLYWGLNVRTMRSVDSCTER